MAWGADLNSTEFQVCQRFIQVLNEMQSIETDALRFHDFYRHLVSMTQAVIFNLKQKKLAYKY